jgi:hypothetical protein
VLLGEGGHLLEVDPLAVGVHAVGDPPVELPGLARREAVGDVAALVEAHAHHRVARLEQGQVGGGVGVGPRVGLDVGVLGAEQRRHPLAGELLDLVDHDVPAVVRFPG